MSTYSPTERTRVRRLKKRATYEKAAVHAILDEALVCHIGFVAGPHPVVIPTLVARDGKTLYVHGSGASRMLNSLATDIEVCLTVTIADGLVLARSAFHHSLNYRSVVVIGRARLVTEPDEKVRALRLITNHVVPQRWEEVRGPNDLELKQTHVLALALNEVSAKIRNGPPLDDEADYALDVWAGVIPLRTTLCAPIADSRLKAEVARIDLSRFGPAYLS
jgi:nitroimidazol reductase NimA-like FMN-containing flavoprotein (pyridoxamine 5'-phosphate oxidase superfamily)